MPEITDEMVDVVIEFLGPDGVDDFRGWREEYGTISPNLMYGILPWPVHFREGMQVRNCLRRSGLCDDWNDHQLDAKWKMVVNLAIDRADFTSEEDM